MLTMYWQIAKDSFCCELIVGQFFLNKNFISFWAWVYEASKLFPVEVVELFNTICSALTLDKDTGETIFVPLVTGVDEAILGI